MILLIDNYDSFTFNLYQLLALHSSEVKVVRNNKITIEQIKALNPKGIVLSPGPGRPEQAGICMEIIEKLGLQIPILGVCLGHQAIAAVFGAQVVSAKEIVHGKKSAVFHCQQHLFQGLPLPFEAGRYHSLVACEETIPACLAIDAMTDDGMIMGLHHKDYPIYGVQFHPESILTPQGSFIIKNFMCIVNGKQNDNNILLKAAC